MSESNQDTSSNTIVLQNNFYADHYKRAVFFLLILFGLIFFLVFIIVYIETHQPKPKYFTLETAGNLVPVIPIDQPNMPDALVLQWMSSVVIDAFDLNYIGYKDHLKIFANNFTDMGWKSFLSQLQKSDNLNTMIQQKMVMHVAATGAPTILEKGVVNGRYSWQVRMPIDLTMQGSGAQPIHQPWMVTTLVTRVEVSDTTPKGIAVVQFVITNS